MKNINPDIKIMIIGLSDCFWFWSTYYTFYGSILGISSRKLEILFPKENFNKYQATEAILEKLEKKNETQKIKRIVESLYDLQQPFDKEKNPKYQKAVEKLRTFKETVGEHIKLERVHSQADTDTINMKREADALFLEKQSQLESLKQKFFEYINCSDNERQERGYWLEKAFYTILELENIYHGNPYRLENEQIDGHFKFGSFDYLVEIKWVEKQLNQSDISIFDGKIKKKALSNRGCILSVSGFSESAVSAASSEHPKMIFIDAQDFIAVLEGIHTMSDILKTKEDNLVRFGKVYK